MSIIRWVRNRRLPLLVASLATLTLLILACGDSDTADESAAAPAAAPVAAATPTPTAAPAVPVSPRLKIAIQPPVSQGMIMPQASDITFTPFYEWALGSHHKTNDAYPMLAESWSVAPGGKQWTFKIRENIPFIKNAKPHGDDVLGAKDITLSMGLKAGFFTEKSNSPGYWTSRFGAPETWETPDDHTLVINLESVDLFMPDALRQPSTSPIVSRDEWEALGGQADGVGEVAYGKHPIGTGPFSFVEIAVDEHILTEKVDNHWRQVPSFDELQFVFIAEEATRTAMLLSGEVHIIPITDLLIQQVKDGGMAAGKSSLPAVQLGGMMNYYRENTYTNPETGKHPGKTKCSPCPGFSEDDPLRQVDVRMALNYSINRDEMNSVFLNGEGFPLLEYFPQWQHCDDSWFPYPGPQGKTGCEGGWPYNYDVEKAKGLLASGGFPDGFDMTIICMGAFGTGMSCDVSEAVAGYFSAIGVNATIHDARTFMDFQSQFARKREEFPWMLISSPGGGGSNPCASAIWQMYWEGGNGWREYKEASNAINNCKTITDLDEFKTNAMEFGGHIRNKAFGLQLMWQYTWVGYNPGVVTEYSVNMSRYGPSLYHEFTGAVMQ